MEYMEQLHKVFTIGLSCEEDLAFAQGSPNAKRLVRIKSVLREMKKEIDILSDELEAAKKALIKDGLVSKESVLESEKEFSK